MAVSPVSARIAIGQHQAAAGARPDDRGVTFELTLAPRRGTLEAWFAGADGAEQGAHYVYANRAELSFLDLPERRVHGTDVFCRRMNIYVELTQQFNDGALRAILSSGQAVVLHRLAVMSKDGDWIVLEDDQSLSHILAVLSEHGARYRFGAPLDARWLAGGWSSHFEFRHGALRIRTDFVSRPPRISPEALGRLWKDQAGRSVPFVDAANLVELKKTNREKDYAVIGELARLIPDPAGQLLYSRSARDIAELARRYPDLVPRLAPQRPLLTSAIGETSVLEAALDAERRALIHANERRLAAYAAAANAWAAVWPSLERQVSALPLPQAHQFLAERAVGLLPFAPDSGGYDAAA